MSFRRKSRSKSFSKGSRSAGEEFLYPPGYDPIMEEGDSEGEEASTSFMKKATKNLRFTRTRSEAPPPEQAPTPAELKQARKMSRFGAQMKVPPGFENMDEQVHVYLIVTTGDLL